MKKLSTKAYITLLAVALVTFNYIISHYEFFHVIKKAASPVVIGFMIAYLMDPLVKFLMKVSKGKLRRGFAILLSILIVISMLGLFSAVLIPSLVTSIQDIIEKINRLAKGGFSLEFLENFLNRFDNNLFNELTSYLNDQLDQILIKVGELSTILLEWALNVFASATSGVYNIFMAFVISIYMLADKHDLLRRIKRLNYAVFEKDSADSLYRTAMKSHEIFSSFFVGKIIDSAIIGVLCFLVMWLMKIPNAPAIGFVVGITNIIPYFGPFIGAVPAILVTVASGTMLQVLLVLIAIVALQQFDGLYLGPKILGDKVGVGAFWIIVSVSVGGALYGVVGMLFGVPVVVLLKTLIEEYVAKSLKDKQLEI